MANSNVTRPDKELKIDSLDEPLRMTYVVFNDILRFVGSIDEAMNSIMNSQDTRDIILRRLLSTHDKPVAAVEDLIPVEQMNIDMYEIDIVLAWVMEHITYFFIQMGGQMQKKISRFPEMVKMMTSSSPSENGTKDSTT